MAFILRTRAVWKALKRPLEEVLDAHCFKSRFLKDVFNEITTFGGSLEPQNPLKPPTTLAWSRNGLNFHLDVKKNKIKIKHSETIKIHHYLQYFELEPVFVGRSEDPC